MSMKSLFYNDDDWLKETVSGTVITFTVRQRYDEAFKTCLMYLFSAGATFLIGYLIQEIVSFNSGWKYLAVLLVIVGAVMALIGVVCLVPAIAIKYQVKPEAKISVHVDRIEVCHAEKLSSYSLDEISHFYWRATDNELRQQMSGTTMVGVGPAGAVAVAAMSTAQNAGQFFGETAREILSANKAKVTINHRGQEKTLAERLSDEEAEFFFGRLKQVLNLTA